MEARLSLSSIHIVIGVGSCGILVVVVSIEECWLARLYLVYPISRPLNISHLDTAPKNQNVRKYSIYDGKNGGVRSSMN